MARYPHSPLFLVHSELEHKDQFSFSPRRLLKDVKEGKKKKDLETNPLAETPGNFEKPVFPGDAEHLPEVLDQRPLLYAHISEVYLLFRKT